MNEFAKDAWDSPSLVNTIQDLDTLATNILEAINKEYADIMQLTDKYVVLVKIADEVNVGRVVNRTAIYLKSMNKIIECMKKILSQQPIRDILINSM